MKTITNVARRTCISKYNNSYLRIHTFAHFMDHSTRVQATACYFDRRSDFTKSLQRGHMTQFQTRKDMRSHGRESSLVYL